MQITLDETKIKDMLTQTIMKELGEENRNILIASAISELTVEQEKGDSWNKKKFIPLHDIFNDAVRILAIEKAREFVSQDAELQTKLQELLKDAMNHVFTTNREKVIEAVSNAFIKGFNRDEY